MDKNIDSKKKAKIKKMRSDLSVLAKEVILDYEAGNLDPEVLREMTMMFNIMHDFYHNLARIGRNRKPIWRPPEGKKS